MTTDILRALIVDDELHACQSLYNLLSGLTGASICVTGTAQSTREAEALIRQHQPDVVFLDIDMPNENAFNFLKRIEPFSFEVIFVTAYDHYAVRAFRLNAVDYILKPVDRSELQKAVEKVQDKMALHHLKQVPLASLSGFGQQVARKAVQDHIVLRSSNRIEVVPFKNILYIEAMRSYSKFLFTSNGVENEFVMSYPITDYEELLPDNLFFRIHRSYLVNRQRITRILREEQPVVLLDNKMKLPVGRRRYPDLLAFLKENSD